MYPNAAADRRLIRAFSWLAAPGRDLLPGRLLSCLFGGGGWLVVESLLPSAVLGKASLRGNEYAWPLADVPEAIAAARSLGLATLGGQVQFRTPDGTCELYWLNADATDRLPGESWAAFVARSAEQVSRGFTGLIAGTDFVAEGVKSFGHLAVLRARGVVLDGFLCFVLYFQAPDAEPRAAPDRRGT